jgi:hypothetical protein
LRLRFHQNFFDRFRYRVRYRFRVETSGRGLFPRALCFALFV